MVVSSQLAVCLLGAIFAAALPESSQLKQLVEKLYQLGDAEIVNGKLILVSLRDVTDRDLALLKDQKDILYLDCAFSKINGSGLVSFQKMKNLKKLWLHDNTIDEKYLKHLVGLQRLERLDLCDTPIGDVGLSFISELKSLKALYLDNTDVSDSGLKSLAKLKSLQQLSIRDTRITKSGVARLKLLLPELKISFSERGPVAALKPNSH